MKWIVNIARIIVGAVFFVSGLIKANDIMGFSYKLEEYFSANVFDMPFMEHYVVPLAALVCIGELALGIATILGAKMKLVSWTLLGLTVFFGFLTFYSAYFDVVKECGCFGDALSLTPWQSFWKDIFLLVFVLIILPFAGKIKLNTTQEDIILGGLGLVLVAILSLGIFDWFFPIPFYILTVGGGIAVKHLIKSASKEWMMAAYVLIACCIFGYYTYNHLPVKDYRAYAVGKSISEQMKTAEELNKKPTTYYTLYTLENEAGESKQVRSDDYLEKEIWKDKSWKINSEKSEGPFVKEQGYEPKIADFKIDTFDGEDLTHSILDDDQPVVVFVYKDLDKAAKSGTDQLVKPLYDALKGNINMITLSPDPQNVVDKYKSDTGLEMPFYIGDQIVLKTFIRSNPGIVLLKKGTVLGKWHINDIPTADKIQALL